LKSENGVDGYHIEATHGYYVMTIDNRVKAKAGKACIGVA